MQAPTVVTREEPATTMATPHSEYSERLQQLNQGKATLITIFNDSIPATWAHANAQLQRLLRMIHFDRAVPLVAVWSFTILAAWFMIQAKSPPPPGNQESAARLQPGAALPRGGVASLNNRPGVPEPVGIEQMAGNYNLVKDLATLLGASLTIQFAILSLHRDHHHKQLQRSSDHMRHWFANLEAADSKLSEFISSLNADGQLAPTDTRLFNVYHSQYSELKRSADGIDRLRRLQSKILIELLSHKRGWPLQPDRGHPRPIELLHNVLNFFENVGLDIKNDVVDSDYLKEYFYSTVIDYDELFRKYIEYAQFKGNTRQTLCNFVYLAQTWEREGSRPAIPRICVRPLVITQADIAAVRDQLPADS